MPGGLLKRRMLPRSSKRAGRASPLTLMVTGVLLIVAVGLVGLVVHTRARRHSEPASGRSGPAPGAGTRERLGADRQPSPGSARLARPQIAPDFDESLANEGLHAIEAGVRWLAQSQQDDGHWSDPSFPAMTGLAVSALLRSPGVLAGGAPSQAASRGLEFILSCVQEDGGIYRHVEGVKGGGLPNYNTAICLTALTDAGDPAYDGIIAAARAFLVAGQHRGDDVFHGGMGYDAATDREYADVPNTYFALEAVRRVEPLERGARQADLDWAAATQFLSRCQHLRAHNDAEWVRETPEEAGGFVYNPVSTKVEAQGDGAEDAMRAYGSATYCGVSGYLNAGLPPQSDRVEAALEWCARHWTLDENPRLGDQSLYFYYLAMAKALNASGRHILDTPRGAVKWRPALVKKLLSLQRRAPKEGLGYWQNDNNRWWENDPNLATSYALLALETAMFGHEVVRELASR